MSIATANLKHLYQRPAMWAISIFMIPMMVFAIICVWQAELMLLTMPAAWLIVLGSVIGGMYAETTACPMSYCLPNHRYINRTLLIVLGAGVTILLSALHLIANGIATLQSYSALGSMVSLYWLAYLSGIMLTLKLKNWSLGFCSFSLFMLTSKIDNINQALLHHIPYLVILCAIYLSYRTWLYLGNVEVSRSLCGKAYVGFNTFNDRKIENLKRNNYKQAQLKNKKSTMVASFVERFFMNKLANSQPASTSHYYWSALYKTSALSISQIKNIWMWLVCSAAFIYIGYFPRLNCGLLLLPMVIAAICDTNIYSQQTITGGRKARFKTALLLMLTYMIVAYCLTAILAVASISLEAILPPIKNFTYNAIDSLELLPIAITLTPACAIFNLLCIRLKSRKIITVAALQGALISTAIASHNLSLQLHWQIIFTISAVALWLLYTHLLRRICLRGQLSYQ